MVHWEQHSEWAWLWVWVDGVTLLLLIFLPFLVISVSACWLSLFLNRVRSLQKQSILLIFSVALIYMISFVPFLVYTIISRAIDEYYVDPMAQFFIIASYVNYLSSMCNPLLYYYTSASFKRFIRRMVCRETNHRNSVTSVVGGPRGASRVASRAASRAAVGYVNRNNNVLRCYNQPRLEPISCEDRVIVPGSIIRRDKRERRVKIKTSQPINFLE